MLEPLKLGTRGSPLALFQAHAVRHALARAHGWPDDNVSEFAQIVIIKTTGDRIQDRSLAEAGGKGLFAKELEEALFDRRIDLAVHSAKDLPSVLPDGLLLSACLEREDPRDAFLSPVTPTPWTLPQNAVIGTTAPRRAAQLLARRPDLQIVLFRGNVDTRLAKLDSGQVHGTLLALAGLKRLGLANRATAILEPGDMLPAAGQGVIALEQRADDVITHTLVQAIAHDQSFQALTAERAFLQVLDGSCRTPLAAYGQFSASGSFHLRGLALSPDGQKRFAGERLLDAPEMADFETAGQALGEGILAQAGRGFFQA